MRDVPDNMQGVEQHLCCRLWCCCLQHGSQVDAGDFSPVTCQLPARTRHRHQGGGVHVWALLQTPGNSEHGRQRQRLLQEGLVGTGHHAHSPWNGNLRHCELVEGGFSVTTVDAAWFGIFYGPMWDEEMVGDSWKSLLYVRKCWSVPIYWLCSLIALLNEKGYWPEWYLVQYYVCLRISIMYFHPAILTSVTDLFAAFSYTIFWSLYQENNHGSSFSIDGNNHSSRYSRLRVRSPREVRMHTNFGMDWLQTVPRAGA